MDEEQQMNAMMGAERVDPVSGNEVPPGAMPEEVRDDVPAMLSEGEYVVPADVLRYYGVRFFEELREKAKQEMGHMEAEGRTGKEMDADEAMPFSMEELNVVEEPDMPMEEGMNKGGYVKGYAEGGPVIDPSVGNMALPDFLQGVSIAGNTSEEYKTYKNDAGLTMTVRFVNGKPTAYIPPGYTEVSATDTVKATDTTSTSTKVEEEKGSGGENVSRGIADMSTKDLENQTRQIASGTGLGGAITKALDNSILGLGHKALTGKTISQAAIDANVKELVGRMESSNTYDPESAAFDMDVTGGIGRESFKSDEGFQAALDSVSKAQEATNKAGLGSRPQGRPSGLSLGADGKSTVGNTVTSSTGFFGKVGDFLGFDGKVGIQGGTSNAPSKDAGASAGGGSSSGGTGSGPNGRDIGADIR